MQASVHGVYLIVFKIKKGISYSLLDCSNSVLDQEY